MGFYIEHDSRRCDGVGARDPRQRIIDVDERQAWALAASTWPSDSQRGIQFNSMRAGLNAAIRLRGGWTLRYSNRQ